MEPPLTARAFTGYAESATVLSLGHQKTHALFFLVSCWTTHGHKNIALQLSVSNPSNHPLTFSSRPINVYFLNRTIALP